MAVLATIEQSASQSSSLPRTVADYLTDAVNAVPDKALEQSSIYLKSSGHRPQEHSGSIEACEVRLVNRKPWPRS